MDFRQDSNGSVYRDLWLSCGFLGCGDRAFLVGLDQDGEFKQQSHLGREI